MNDFQTYLKAAKKTAQRQYEAANLEQKLQAQKQRAAYQAREGAENLKAAAKVSGRRYRQARMTQRLLAALRDLSMMALSLGVIWFVFSRIIPVPVSWVFIALAVLFVLRLYWAIVHNPYLETEVDDPLGMTEDQLPQDAKIKKGKRRGAKVLNS